MNEIQLFNNSEFGSIRVVDVDGIPYFVGKDVAEILGYSNTSKALADHVDSEDKLYNESLSSLGQRGGWLINESGVYALVFGSKLPEAKKFKHWVTADVLPSIRKHGAYMTEHTLDKLLNDPDLVIGLATQLKEERAKVKEEQERNEKLTEQNEELNIKTIQQSAEISKMKPMVDYVNKVLNSQNLLNIGQIAKDYGVSAYVMNNWLRELRVQYYSNGQWLLYAPYQDKGYTVSTTYAYGDTKSPGSAMHTKWTQRGREFIYWILKKKKGIVPLSERSNQPRRLY